MKFDDPDDPLDRLMYEAAPELPSNFVHRVMSSLPAPASPWLRRLSALALAGGGLLGLTQVLAYLFGVWVATAAG